MYFFSACYLEYFSEEVLGRVRWAGSFVFCEGVRYIAITTYFVKPVYQ